MSKIFHIPVVICSMFFSLSACAEKPAPEQTAVVGEQKLTLVEKQQRCVMQAEGSEDVAMDIPWPCQFSVDRNGSSHVETFHNVPIVIVLHAVKKPDSRSCASQYRAVRLMQGKLEPSVISHSAACYTGVGDQKDYTGVFEW